MRTCFGAHVRLRSVELYFPHPSCCNAVDISFSDDMRYKEI